MPSSQRETTWTRMGLFCYSWRCAVTHVPLIYYKCDDPSLLHGGSKSRAIIGFEADFCTIPSLQRAEWGRHCMDVCVCRCNQGPSKAEHRCLNHASDKTLGHELPPPAPLSHCGGRLPEYPPGFHGTSSSSWAMNHPITRVEFLEMTWNDRPKEATVSSGNVAYLPRRIVAPKGRGWYDLHQKDVQTCGMRGFLQDSKNCWRDCVLQILFQM